MSIKQEGGKTPQEVFSDIQQSLHSLPAQKRFMLAIITMTFATLTVGTVWFFFFLSHTNLRLPAIGQVQQPKSLTDLTETAQVGPAGSIVESLKGLGEKIAPKEAKKDPFGFGKVKASALWTHELFANLEIKARDYVLLLKKIEQIGSYLSQQLIYYTSRTVD